MTTTRLCLLTVILYGDFVFLAHELYLWTFVDYFVANFIHSIYRYRNFIWIFSSGSCIINKFVGFLSYFCVPVAFSKRVQFPEGRCERIAELGILHIRAIYAIEGSILRR